MRPLFLVPAVLIVPFAVIHFLGMFTGDPLSAIGLALIIFITIAGWFAGFAGARGRRTAGRS